MGEHRLQGFAVATIGGSFQHETVGGAQSAMEAFPQEYTWSANPGPTQGHHSEQQDHQEFVILAS